MNTSPDHSKTSMGIRGKLFTGFLAVGLASILCILTGLIFNMSTEKYSNHVIGIELPIFSAMIDMDSEVSGIRSSLYGYMLSNDAEDLTSLKLYKDQLALTINLLDKYINEERDESEKTNWNTIKTSVARLLTMQDKVLSMTDKKAAIAFLVSDMRPLLIEISTKLNAIDQSNDAQGMVDIQYNKLNTETQGILSDIHNMELVKWLSLIVIGILVVIITMITANRIIPPLKSAIRIAKEIAASKRNVVINVESDDETGELLTVLSVMQESIKLSDQKLKNSELETRELLEKIVKSVKLFSDHSSRVASGDLRQHLTLSANENDVMNQLGSELNKMTTNLAEITKEITQSCQDMVVMVSEVNHSINSQSSGASEQASSVNEITASLAEIEKSSAQTMHKARNLGDISERTRERGQLGIDAVDQSVQGMVSVRNKVQTIAETILELSNQTQQIGEITTVVNNLAQQSKMLALNASIEAAKAGEAGKGFAVVAVEVKNLAEQSEQATSQVQKILENIRRATEKAVMATEEGTKGVDQGKELVEQTGDIIRGLNDVIHEVTIASQQIEAAVRQEGAGIEQITTGMNEINKVTQSFVESVKQTTEAIGNLSSIANNLKSYTDTYKV